jgi:hypothetical protein
MKKLVLTLVMAAISVPAMAQGNFYTVKGQVVWDDASGPVPKRAPIKATKDEDVAAKDKDFNTEDWIVDPKTGGVKNVVIWLAPEPPAAVMANLKSGKLKDFPSYDPKDIHPSLAKPAKPSVEIDQPCCRFIPHVLLAREGQEMLIKNSAPIPHNAKWVSRKNGDINPLIPSGGKYKLESPLVAEKFPIEISCSIHPWMKAWVRVFDHPYFVATDEAGNFEIKDAPVLTGNARLFVWHEDAGFLGGANGRFGTPIVVKAGVVTLDTLKLGKAKE